MSATVLSLITTARSPYSRKKNSKFSEKYKGKLSKTEQTAVSPDGDVRQHLLESLKREVKQIMEEAVTKKFIHADSSSLTSLCAAVEAGIAHGLKKRAAGLLPAQNTQTILFRLGKLSEPVGDFARLLQEDDNEERAISPVNPFDSPRRRSPVVSKKINGYTVSGPSTKYLWIRIAILEKALPSVIDALIKNASLFYEPYALLSDTADARIFTGLIDGPCALDYSKMKTPDSYWTDPSADELVQRHRIHSGHSGNKTETTAPCTPQLSVKKSSSGEGLMVAPILAREHIESLHQNSQTTLLYGKNNVSVQPVEGLDLIAGYLSLHKTVDSLLVKWTPNQLMHSSGDTDEKSQFWDFAVTIDLQDVVYIHCHHKGDEKGIIVMIGQDGIQRPPIHFPTTSSTLQFLSCLESGLNPYGHLDPPLWAPRGKGLSLPKLKKKTEGMEQELRESKDFVFRVISSTKNDVDFNHDLDKMSLTKKPSKRESPFPWRQDSLKPIIPQGIPKRTKPNTVPTRESLQLACETMRKQILSRAFNGWWSSVRHLSTVRKHLACLVHEDIVNNDEPSNGSEGLTKDKWDNFQHNGRVTDDMEVMRYVYYGGVAHDVRKEVWPYLLGHYKFGSTERDRQDTDRKSKDLYNQILSEWKQVESAVQQRERELSVACEPDGISVDSMGSQDEVFDNTEEKIHKDEKPHFEPIIELPNQDIELDILVNGNEQKSKTHVNGDEHVDSESGYYETPDENRQLASEEIESEVNCNKCGKRLSQFANRDNSDIYCQCGMAQDDGIGSTGSRQCDCHRKRGYKLTRHSSNCSQSSEQSMYNGYSIELLENFGLNVHRIDKDVLRCDRNYWYFTHSNLEKLRNVMCSYVWETLEIGYVQGMCDLVAPLLVIFDDEAKTYSCFVELMKRMNNNFPHGAAMDSHFANMRSLIQILDPEMFDHMHTNGDLTHFYFCYRWFLLDFKRELEYDDVFKVWEIIWAAKQVASHNFVLFIALALLESYRDIILDNRMDFTDIIKFFNEMAENHNANNALHMARQFVYKVQSLIENK